MKELTRIDEPSNGILREFYLDRRLASKDLKPTVRRDNLSFFEEDLHKGRLNNYQGTYIAYFNGKLVSQSVNKDKLGKELEDYYGPKNLSVFRVPEDIEDYLG